MSVKNRLDNIEKNMDFKEITPHDPRLSDKQANRLKTVLRTLTNDELWTIVHAGSGAKLTEPEAELYNRVTSEAFNVV